ncbi:MAG: putative CXXCH cytochrome family protein [Planctomycetota bacterium]|jgi:predicted CXXCH cytochrome family protein
MLPGKFQLVAILALAGIVLSVMVDDSRSASEIGKVELPQPQMPLMALQCVEPVDVMRREHMNFLLDQRDATVIDGNRDKKYSLTGCINCHNPKIENQPVIRNQDPEFFCSSCHQFTGVKLDCFECHTDQAEKLL